MALDDDILSKALEGRVATNENLRPREEPFTGHTSLNNTVVTGRKTGFAFGFPEDVRLIGDIQANTLLARTEPDDHPWRTRRLSSEFLFYGFDVYAEGTEGEAISTDTLDTHGVDVDFLLSSFAVEDLFVVVTNYRQETTSTGLDATDNLRRFNVVSFPTGDQVQVDISDGVELPNGFNHLYWSIGVKKPVEMWPLPNQTGTPGEEVTYLCARPMDWPVNKVDPSVPLLVNKGFPAINILTTEQPQDGDTVTIDGKTYTFQTTLTDVDGNVQIGADVFESMDNLEGAIDLESGTPGVDYAASTTAHPTVIAYNPFPQIIVGTDGFLAVQAREAGVSGNSIAVSETLTTATGWNQTTLYGGSDAMQIRADGQIEGQVTPLTASGQVLNVGDWVTLPGNRICRVSTVSYRDNGSIHGEDIRLQPFYGVEVTPTPSGATGVGKIFTARDFFPLGTGVTGSPLNDLPPNTLSSSALDQIWVRNLVSPRDAHPDALTASATLYETTGKIGFRLTLFVATATGEPDLTNPITEFENLVIDSSVTGEQQVSVDYQNGMVRLSHPIADGDDLNPAGYRDSDGRAKLFATFVAYNDEVAPEAAAALVARPRQGRPIAGASSRVRYNDADSSSARYSSTGLLPIEQEPGWLIEFRGGYSTDLYHAQVEGSEQLLPISDRAAAIGFSDYQYFGGVNAATEAPDESLALDMKFQLRHPYSGMFHLGQMIFGALANDSSRENSFTFVPDAVNDPDFTSGVHRNIPPIGTGDDQVNFRVATNGYTVASSTDTWAGTTIIPDNQLVSFIINDVPVEYELGNLTTAVPDAATLAPLLSTAVSDAATALGIDPGTYSITESGATVVITAQSNLIFRPAGGNTLLGFPDSFQPEISDGIALHWAEGTGAPTGSLEWDKTTNTWNFTGGGASLQINGVGVLGGGGGTTTADITSLSDNYEELDDGTLGDTLFDTLQALYGRLQANDSLQDLVENSHVRRTGPVSNTKQFSQFLDATLEPAGSLAGTVTNAGNWSPDVHNSIGYKALSSDGRYVCLPFADDQVRIYNQRDLSEFATVTLTSAPVNGITALASDGFSLAVAYDSKIEMFDLTAGPPAKDTGWATSGIYTHSSTATDHIVDMHFQAQWLYCYGYDADGSGDTTTGDSLFILDRTGSTIADGDPLVGTAVSMDVWGQYIVVSSDHAGPGNNVAVVEIDTGAFNTLWGVDLTLWNTVIDTAINQRGVAIVGLDGGTTDPRMVIYDLFTGDQISDRDLGALDTDVIQVTKTKNQFITSQNSTASTACTIAGWSLDTAELVSGQLYTKTRRLWAFSPTISGSQFFWPVTTDGQYVYSVRIDVGASANEQLRRYTMGVGSGNWVVSKRTGAGSGDFHPVTVYPLDVMYLYGDM